LTLLATTQAVSHGHRNYFDLFDLPIDFSVDPIRLSERYRSLIDDELPDDPRRAGPTRASHAFEIEAAYRTLSDPLARAAYFLALLDDVRQDPPGDDRLQAELMAQMELQESLSEGGNRPDPAGTAASVLTRLAERGAWLEKDLQRCLADPSPSNLESARDILRRLELIGLYQRRGDEVRQGAGWRVSG
jgi:molecular chaperone HscB